MGLFFGPFYYWYLGMPKKMLMLFVAVIAIGIGVNVIEYILPYDLNWLDKLSYFIVPTWCAQYVNFDYYAKAQM